MKPDIRVIWAAGFIDGEGCFYSRRQNVRSYTARITASQNVRHPLDVLQSLFGGRVEWIPQSKSKRGGIWRWTIEQRDQVIYCCEMLEPWLLVKHRQAHLLGLIASHLRTGRGRDPAGYDRASAFAAQEELAEQLLVARSG